LNISPEELNEARGLILFERFKASEQSKGWREPWKQAYRHIYEFAPFVMIGAVQFSGDKMIWANQDTVLCATSKQDRFDDFFAMTGIWENREVDQQALRN
jgi:hypothetical protein